MCLWGGVGGGDWAGWVVCGVVLCVGMPFLLCQLLLNDSLQDIATRQVCAGGRVWCHVCVCVWGGGIVTRQVTR